MAQFARSCLSKALHCLLAGRLPDFFHCCLQQKGHWAHITMSMFQVLGAAETQRYKYFNFNQRAPGFKQTFNMSRVTAGTTACNSPAAV